MKLTTKGRYAVMAMADLATNENLKPISLSEISVRQNISLSYLEQLFVKLKNNHLVKSVRGPHGGYVLDKCITHNLWDDLEKHINGFFENKNLNELISKQENIF